MRRPLTQIGKLTSGHSVSDMSKFASQDQWLNKWLVFGAVSLVFFFLNLATFTSLGVVLYSMVAELRWSLTAAGFSFAFLGLACGLSSPLAALTMKWFGGRVTICIGSALLLIGFFIASISQSVFMFYVAMTFLGVGYSLAGNVPGVYLIAAWFKLSSARIIGLYLMLGALGAAFGPPIVEFIVSGSGGWRGHWQVMAITAGVVGLVCFALVRDAEPLPVADTGPKDRSGAIGKAKAAAAMEWDPRRAVFTSQFLLIAGVMTGTMACVTTYSSVLVNHLVKLGATPSGAAFVLSAIAITATLVKAFAGRMCESIAPKYIVAAGVLLQAGGSAMLAFAGNSMLQYASALVFGTGWGLAYVAGTVVLLDYFGGTTGSKILSIVWFLVSVAAAGPIAAGMIADRYGTFAPIFLLYAGMLVALAVPIFAMRRPVARVSAAYPAEALEARLVSNIETV